MHDDSSDENPETLRARIAELEQERDVLRQLLRPADGYRDPFAGIATSLNRIARDGGERVAPHLARLREVLDRNAARVEASFAALERQRDEVTLERDLRGLWCARLEDHLEQLARDFELGGAVDELLEAERTRRLSELSASGLPELTPLPQPAGAPNRKEG